MINRSRNLGRSIVRVIRGVACVEDVELLEMARRHGTPLVVFSRQRLEDNVTEFQSAFRHYFPTFKLFYSFKTNYSSAVCGVIKTLGVGAEVVSMMEFFLARALGFRGNQIIFNGPGKRATDIDEAIREGSFLINVDSPTELDALLHATPLTNRKVNIGVRIDPFSESTSKLGLNPKDSLALISLAAKHERVRVRGVHMHLGTLVVDPKLFAEGLSRLLAVKREAERLTGYSIEVIDIGGGFTREPTRARARGSAPIAAYAEAVYTAVSAAGVQRDFTLVAEPGRYIVNDAALCITSVLATKSKGPRHWAICDVGLSTLPRLTSAAYWVLPLRKRPGTDHTTTHLGGPLCMAHDVLPSVNATLEVGDHLAVMNCGAYTLSLSSVFSYPRPAIVMVDGGSARLGRRRESHSDVASFEQPRAGGRCAL